MPPEQTQPPQEVPQEVNQDEMIVQFLQELDARITALEEKANPQVEEPKENA